MVTIYSCFTLISTQKWVHEFFAEFLGTFLLIFMGNNAVAENILTYGQGGTTVTIYLGYAIGLLLGILVSIGVSGAHLNPAVTVAGVLTKKFESSKVAHYIIAQYLGGFIAACATYLLYKDSFEAYHDQNGISNTTASIFHTYPKEDLSVIGAFVDQILGTMVLMIGIYAVTDNYNAKIPFYLAPLYITLILVGIGCSIGVNEGFALNPARDLSPRIFTYITFWGGDVFSANTYWYVPIFGPHIGGILGAFIYVIFIEKLHNQGKDFSSFDNCDEIICKGDVKRNSNHSVNGHPKEQYRVTCYL